MAGNVLLSVLTERMTMLMRSKNDIINNLDSFTEYVMRRGRWAKAHRAVPEEVLNDLEEAIQTCTRIQAEIRSRYASMIPEMDINADDSNNNDNNDSDNDDYLDEFSSLCEINPSLPDDCDGYEHISSHSEGNSAADNKTIYSSSDSSQPQSSESGYDSNTFVKQPIPVDDVTPTSPHHQLELPLGIIAPVYPSDVIFHGYIRNEMRIMEESHKVYFDQAYSSLKMLYHSDVGCLTIPYRGYYNFHLSIKARYDEDANANEESSCVLRVARETGYTQPSYWSVCEIKHGGDSTPPTEVVSCQQNVLLHMGEPIRVEVFSTRGTWRAEKYLVNLFVLLSSKQGS